MDHLDAVVSDLSVFHRVDRWESMPAPRFLAYARQLVHYRGAVRGEATMELQQEEAAGGPSSGGQSAPGGDLVDATVAPIHPGFAGDGAGFPPVFEVRKAAP